MNRFLVKSILVGVTATFCLATCLFVASGRSPSAHSGQGVEISIGILPYGEAFSHAPVERHLDLRAIDSHFDVIITNRSAGPLDFFTDGNSWGDHTLTFTLTSPDGRQTPIQNSTMAYSRNFPAVVRLQPGESWAREIPFGRRPWAGITEAAQPYEGQTVKIQADLSQGTQNFKKDPYVWSGHVQSKPIEVSIRR